MYSFPIDTEKLNYFFPEDLESNLWDVQVRDSHAHQEDLVKNSLKNCVGPQSASQSISHIWAAILQQGKVTRFASVLMIVQESQYGLNSNPWVKLASDVTIHLSEIAAGLIIISMTGKCKVL